MGATISLFRQRFQSIARKEREQILCGMIRINYGTPWEGDLNRLKEFFSQEYHSRLVLGGLTELIETLSPFADEPTNYTVTPEEPTLRDTQLTAVFNSEITLPAEQITTEVPLNFRDSTITSK